MRNSAGRFVVVVSASVQVTIEAREVTAGNFDANAMAGLEEIACVHRRETKLVNLAGLHPHERLVVAVAITQPLNRLIQIVSTTIRIDVDQLHGEVCVLHIGRNIERDFDRTAQFDAFFQRLSRVNKDVVALFHLALIPRTALHRVARAADVAAIRRHRVHRIVIEFVRRVGRWG